MANNSTILIRFKVANEGNGLKALTLDANALKKAIERS